MTSAAASPADEAVAQSLDTPHHRRIAWCAFDRFGCQSDQFIGVEARSEALQSLRCDGPVAIATRAFQQIEVMIEAFLESGAKFGLQRRILAAAGLTAQLVGQAFINILVNLQLFPSKGMTLPLISYGGSSTLAVCFTLGLLLAITRRNPFLAREAGGLRELIERKDTGA